MKLICTIAALLISFGCAADSRQVDQSSPEFNYIAVHWQASEASEDVMWRHFLRTGDSVALHPEALIETPHFAEARTTYDPQSDSHSADLVMTAEGRKRIKQLSTGNAGRSLAIVIDDDVVAVAYVSGPIDSEALNLPPMQDESEAESFANRINAALTKR